MYKQLPSTHCYYATAKGNVFINFLLHFMRVIDDTKCILVTVVCVCVCLSFTAFPHYCTDPDVTPGNGRKCPLVVHYWVDLQFVHRYRCFDNIAPNAKCQQVHALTLCLVIKLSVWNQNNGITVLVSILNFLINKSIHRDDNSVQLGSSCLEKAKLGDL